MAKQRVKFTFPPELVKEPLIYSLGKEYNVVTNIRRANVTVDEGWVILELEGDLTDIERGISYVVAQGVQVDPIDGDVLAG
ncbi:MAG: NIL domain-containing protein [Dehalococcoidales bacterium]|nr:NIL domain-containing protein [Dehalococcoidales bacterium]